MLLRVTIILSVYMLCWTSSPGVVVSLTNGLTSFTYDDGNSSSASLITDGIDNLYEYKFYYFDSNGNVTNLDNNGSLNLAGDTITYLPEAGVEIDIKFALTSPTEPNISVSLSVTNTTGSQLNGNIVFYFDYDLNGGFTNHNASINPANDTITVTAPNNARALITGTNYDAYQIAAFSGLRSSISAGTLLNNTGNNFGPADFTGAFQWNINLQNNTTTQFASNTVVPEPTSTPLILGSVLTAYYILRRPTHKFNNA